jgi:hypothetical protein
MTQSVETPKTRQEADPEEDLICEALHLALSAIHLDIACHSGVISAEAAMERLHEEIVKTVVAAPDRLEHGHRMLLPTMTWLPRHARSLRPECSDREVTALAGCHLRMLRRRSPCQSTP